MWLLWFLIALAPSAGCLALVCVAPRPNLIAAMCGAVMGLIVSVCIFVGMPS